MKMMQMNHTNQNTESTKAVENTFTLNDAKRLHNSRNYAEAEETYRTLFLEDKDAFERNDRVFFLRCINESRIKGNYSTHDLKEQTQFVLENFTQEDCSNRKFKDPYAEILINIAKQYNERNYYLNALDTIWKVKAELLTTYNPPIKRNTYAYSLKEKWYSTIIDALIGYERYDSALEYAINALEVLPDSKSNAKLWIRYKLAKIHYNLGNYRESLDILNEILKVKKENFVYSQIARNYYGLNDYDEALDYAIKAVLANRSVQNNLGTYTLIAELLDKKGMKEESIKHHYLVYTFKKANDHHIDDDLIQIIENANLDMENGNFRKVQKELVPLWNELKFANMERYDGTIGRVFNDKRIGFIDCDSFPRGVYFKFRDFKDEEYFICEGINVSFYAVDSYDYSKNRESHQAIEIEVEFDKY